MIKKFENSIIFAILCSWALNELSVPTSDKFKIISEYFESVTIFFIFWYSWSELKVIYIVGGIGFLIPYFSKFWIIFGSLLDKVLIASSFDKYLTCNQACSKRVFISIIFSYVCWICSGLSWSLKYR